ncbi:hypothetical protein LPJ66_003380 [Kickxella alabastrina]|uniref:Uncharacterized protein n=1 Tax=Kickxella alabastrina TaxID=61397 RepID=A0ACC1IMB5_9FUNG|nr:hypothetical protein LPJ66_003380 [Kickxella alabastrina]
MVCIICYESLFKKHHEPAASNMRVRAADSRPAALSCGHVFHNKCIAQWFTTSDLPKCPLCHKTSTSPALTLFIELDKEDAFHISSSTGNSRDSRGGEVSASEPSAQLGGLTASGAGGSQYNAQDFDRLAAQVELQRVQLDAAVARKRALHKKLNTLYADLACQRKLSNETTDDLDARIALTLTHLDFFHDPTLN